jgi:GH3 auxin-responsive promoter
MPSTKFLAPIVGNKWVRRAADALLVRYSHNRTAALDRMDAGKVQHDTLMSLVRRARNTRFGRDHDFARMYSVADFQARVPIREYEFFWNTYWKDTYPNLDNITWPGKIPYYALSSGTTSGTTKYLPVSWEMVRSNKKAGFTTMALFRHSHPGAKLFTGRFFFLGGCTDLRKQSDGSLAGDLSGIAAQEVHEFLRPYIFPPLEVSLLTDWDEKMRRFTDLSVNEPITAFSGVPSWMLVLFDRLKRHTGKKTIAEVWPELRLIVHGGTKFDPYREIFKKEIGSDLVKTCEVYPCSEAFIATEDPRYPGLMRVVPDHDNFFEFVPVEELGNARPTRHTLANVELGVQYAVVISSCAGVWSYLVGDTVAFESRTPPLLRFTGRTKYFLSAFGEHLISEEVEKGVAHAAELTGASATDFHVGAVFSPDPTKPGHHLYMIEFATVPADLAKFVRELDAELSRLNEDYETHRKSDLAMLLPVVRVVKRGGFQEWMRARGKAGGANKVPRMDNTGKMTHDMAAWFEANNWLA